MTMFLVATAALLAVLAVGGSVAFLLFRSKSEAAESALEGEPAAVDESPSSAAAPLPLSAVLPSFPPGDAPEDAPAPPGGPVQIEKLRIAELGLVLRVWGLEVAGEEVLAFATEGLVARNREELVLYARRAAVPDGDVVRNLKRFAGLALILLERVEPVRVGELLRVPGEIGSSPLGGYLVVEAAEPEPVPFGQRLVVIGLPRRLLATEPTAIRSNLSAEAGGSLWLTAV